MLSEVSFGRLREALHGCQNLFEIVRTRISAQFRFLLFAFRMSPTCRRIAVQRCLGTSTILHTSVTFFHQYNTNEDCGNMTVAIAPAQQNPGAISSHGSQFHAQLQNTG